MYMLIFAFTLVLVLWLCQIVYLDSFYKYIKTHEAEKALDELTEVFEEDSEDKRENLKEIASEYELCVRVVNADGKSLYSVENSFGCVIHMLKSHELAMYYERTVENGGKIVFTSDKKENVGVPKEKPDDIPPKDNDDTPIEENLVKVMKHGRESMVCAAIIDVDGEDSLILVDARLTPVDATVNTLRYQLVIISVIMIVLALVLALLVSKTISLPISNVNNKAKELAYGNYNIDFDSREYREISELSDTLNFTAKELAKTEKYQQELIANVSHDLRTPLTMITAYSEVMRDIPGENSPENVQVIIDEAERLTNLVNDLLDISKLQRGVLEKEAKVYDLTASIESVMERYGKLKTQDGYDIRFEFYEHVMVEADEFKIFQVLYNLINNAINYTGDDKKVVVRQIIKGDKVRIEVEDTGPGIKKDELANVWDRYYKASSSHKRAVKGSGLGLSIVRSIMKLHNASYGVESEEEKGSIFWFELDRYKLQKDL